MVCRLFGNKPLPEPMVMVYCEVDPTFIKKIKKMYCGLATPYGNKDLSTLVQLMACRLFGNKPLPEPVMVYCEVDPTFIKKCIVG